MSRSRTPLYALLAANTLSFISEAISMVAIPWFVLGLTGSASQVGLIGFFTVLPRVIATFLGGQVVDRIGFRTSSIVSDLLSGLSVCGIPILYASGHLTFSWLVVLVIFGAVFDGPGATARRQWCRSWRLAERWISTGSMPSSRGRAGSPSSSGQPSPGS